MNKEMQELKEDKTYTRVKINGIQYGGHDWT